MGLKTDTAALDVMVNVLRVGIADVKCNEWAGIDTDAGGVAVPGAAGNWPEASTTRMM